MDINQDTKYAVIAESNDYSGKELYLHDLSFAQLMDDIVVPYESDNSFFIDGVQVKKGSLKKIKIVRQKPSFESLLIELHYFLRAGSSSSRKVPAKDYPILLSAIFREAGEDVTAQVIKAYDNKIRPSLKDYLPKREELIRGAFEVFLEGMKLFAKGT